MSAQPCDVCVEEEAAAGMGAQDGTAEPHQDLVDVGTWFSPNAEDRPATQACQRAEQHTNPTAESGLFVHVAPEPKLCGLWGCTLSRRHNGICNAQSVGRGSRQRKRPEVYDDSAEQERRERLVAEKKQKESSRKRNRTRDATGSMEEDRHKRAATRLPQVACDSLTPAIATAKAVRTGTNPVRVSFQISGRQVSLSLEVECFKGPRRGSAGKRSSVNSSTDVAAVRTRPLCGIPTTRSSGEPAWSAIAPLLPIAANLPTPMDTIELNSVANSLSSQVDHADICSNPSIESWKRGNEPTSAAEDAAELSIAQRRALAKLQDFLPMGHSDPFANRIMASKQADLHNRRHAKLGIRWGCKCNGWIRNGGAKLRCHRCELWFHTRCEKLDYTSGELRGFASAGTFECQGCERARLAEEGFDLSVGQFCYACRVCGREYDDEVAARLHSRRCVSKRQRRRWSCACAGDKESNSASTGAGMSCESCKGWFHRSCKLARLGMWETNQALCEACDQESATSRATNQVSTHREVGNDVASRVGSSRSHVRARRAAAVQAEMAVMLATPQELVIEGTLSDGRVFVKPSLLGAKSGFGLFAGVQFKRGDSITTYDGPLLYKSEVHDEQDTSYMLRIPNSGGCVIDGKVIADEIRANRANPADDGYFYPHKDSEWLHRGAGSMCNDPRDTKKYNARITFRQPQGQNKALCQLAPMCAVLIATRDIAPREEIYFSYGSDKPFEHLKKKMQQREILRKLEEEKSKAVEVRWQPR